MESSQSSKPGARGVVVRQRQRWAAALATVAAGHGSPTATHTIARVPMVSSGFSSQARALTAKSWAFQSRKRCQNCCLIFLPLLFMTLLAVLQNLINEQIKKAGLTCAEAVSAEVTCKAGNSCAGVTQPMLVAMLGQCLGSPESNSDGKDGQVCVYPSQVGNVAAAAGKVTFTIGPALTGMADRERGALMPQAMVQQKLMDAPYNSTVPTNPFEAVTMKMVPDIANSRTRQLPFCPIGRPEPFPPFTLTPKRAYRYCASPNDEGCTTLLATGGGAGYEGSTLLTGLLSQYSFARPTSVFLAAIASGSSDASILQGFLTGGGNSSNAGGGQQGGSSLNAASLLSSNGQSELLPLLADALADTTLGTPAVPSSTLYLDAAFSSANQYRRRLSHGDGPDETYGSGFYAYSASCPLLKQAARDAAATVSGQPQPTVWENEILSPALPLACLNTSVLAHGSSSSLDAAVFAGYYNDDETNDDAKNSIIQEFAGAFDFRGTSAGGLYVDVIYNDTNQARTRGGPPRLVRINNPVNMATQAFLKKRCGSGTDCSAKLSSLRMMPQPARSLNLDFSSLLGPLFYVWLLQLLFPIGLTAIVYEKEMRLRMMIKMNTW